MKQQLAQRKVVEIKGAVRDFAQIFRQRRTVLSPGDGEKDHARRKSAVPASGVGDFAVGGADALARSPKRPRNPDDGSRAWRCPTKSVERKAPPSVFLQIGKDIDFGVGKPTANFDLLATQHGRRQRKVGHCGWRCFPSSRTRRTPCRKLRSVR